MYTDVNFKTKKALKEAVAAGKLIGVYQPNNMFNTPTPKDGRVCVEGPQDNCVMCGISLINVDAAVIGDSWYCPDCVQPKYLWYVIEVNNDLPTNLIGGFATDEAAASWATAFCDGDYSILSLTPPDFS